MEEKTRRKLEKYKRDQDMVFSSKLIALLNVRALLLGSVGLRYLTWLSISFCGCPEVLLTAFGAVELKPWGPEAGRLRQ